MEKIKLFSMFSGYGGAEFGLKKANIPFECVGYSEINKYAIQCYDQNHPNIKNYGDCSKINPQDLPDFDLLTGGFPCTDVSIAGKRDLSLGRTNLFYEIIRIAKEKKPKYMLLENVKGLLSMNRYKMNKSYFDKVKEELRKIGYGICYKVLNSKEYGIPQNRERIWIVCKYGGWDFNEFTFPEKEDLKIFLKDILEENVDKKYFLSKKMIEYMNKSNFNADQPIDISKPCKTLKVGGDVPCFKIEIFNAYNNKILKDNRVSTTLRTNWSNGNSQIISPCLTTELAHSTSRHWNANRFYELTNELRRLTPKECFRLMGFLDDGINLNNISDTQRYRLAGNGWEIGVVSKIFKNLFKE